MSRTWFFISIIALWLAISALPQAGPALAQTADPPPGSDENCTTCHEHEYYVYDTGKWFCLCEAQMHCVYCHGGRIDTTDKDLAHEGMVLYPTRDHAARCRTCHTEDYMARAVTFASVAGVSEKSAAVAYSHAVLGCGGYLHRAGFLCAANLQPARFLATGWPGGVDDFAGGHPGLWLSLLEGRLPFKEHPINIA